MALKLRYTLLLGLVSSASFIYGCQAEAPAPKTSSTQNLLAQVEAIEADEATLLFQQAKVAAEKDNVKEAQSLIQQALGRGAGSTGMDAAEAEIKKAEARIAERKRKAEESRQATIRAENERREREQSDNSVSIDGNENNDLLCYSLADDARNACLNKPYQIRNEDSRNILLGFCHDVSRFAKNQGFDQVCARGKNGCYSLKNGNLQYSCSTCDGSKRWAATAIAGSVLKCR